MSRRNTPRWQMLANRGKRGLEADAGEIGSTTE